MRIAMFAATAIVLLSAGCSTAGKANVPKPEIQIVQLYAPTDLGYARGASSMTAHFGFVIKNVAAEHITLKRIELQSVGQGGYSLRREMRTYSRQIPSGSTVEETIQAQAFFQPGVSGDASNEPVTVRGTFYFDAPSGQFRHIVLRNIGQFSSGPR